MATLVLVHGAWHYGELWAPVRAHLEKAGHTVHTPTAGGREEGGPHDVSLDESWRPIADYIVEHDLRDIVLLGHSWGGFLIAKVAEQLPDRIRRLVFQNAFVPLTGENLFDNCPGFFLEALTAIAEARGDGTTVLPFEVWRDGFINDADADLARAAYDKLRPQGFRTFSDPVDLTRFYELTIPRSYINATEDNCITQGEWGWHPRMSNRLGVFRLVQLPGSHEVMFTNPELLAQKIEEAGRD